MKITFRQIIQLNQKKKNWRKRMRLKMSEEEDETEDSEE